MNLPPLQSPISASYHASGDVAIATDAVIAPGVVLMADPAAQIIIGAGACLGLGVVLHASQGDIIVEAGVSLGAGVLAVGRCRIGTQACVGASTTLHNASVAPGQLVAPGSLLGEMGRSPGESRGVAQGPAQAAGSHPRSSGSGYHNGTSTSPWDDEPEANSATAASADSAASSGEAPKMEEAESGAQQPSSAQPSAEQAKRQASNGAASAAASEPPPKPKKPTKVYGKAQFERMRVMFRPD